MKSKVISRRKFIQSTGLMMLGSTVMLAGCRGGDSGKPELSLPSTSPTPQVPSDSIISSQNKALVFIMLDGGNDSFNMLVPTSKLPYSAYKKSRNHLALSLDQLRKLDGFTDKRGQSYGLHPSINNMQKLFGQQKLAFVANVAPMIQPTTKAAFLAGSVPVPLGLMSHSDQFKHWQTARPGERVNKGWFGRFADILQRDKADDQISMNISLAGSNIMQSGVASREYAITAQGSTGLKVKNNSNPELAPLNNELLRGFESILQVSHNEPFKDTYIQRMRFAQAQHERFKAAMDTVSLAASFRGRDQKVSPLAEQLQMVAKAIAAGPGMGMSKQTFFVRYIGWDHHSELLNKHAEMLAVLDDALGSFQEALSELGIDERVVTFTGSDFGRTLTSNGNGTDHGWGGNTIVMGTQVDGGKIYGDYPDLGLGAHNPLDIGNGVLIPTTSTDELYAELALWFGMQKNELGRLFPNLKHFYDIENAESSPLEMLRA